MQLDKYKKREKHNVTDSTLKSRLSALKNLEEFADGDEPGSDDVEDWVDYMIDEYENNNMKAGTIKQYFKAAKYYWQKVHGDADEIEHIRDWIPTGETDHGDFLDREEWDEFREAIISPREKAIVELMYYYARRPGEIILLNMSDVNLDEKTITFTILKKDDPLRATFELKQEARAALESYFNYRANIEVEAKYPWEDGETVDPIFTTSHGRISYDTVWRKMKNLASKAGIDKNISPKSMRHSRTTHLDWEGEAPEVIARQQLVHDPDSDVVGHYIHPRGEEDVREVMSLDDE